MRHLDGHDVVLALGAPLFVYHQEGFGPFLPAGTQVFSPSTIPTSPPGCRPAPRS